MTEERWTAEQLEAAKREGHEMWLQLFGCPVCHGEGVIEPRQPAPGQAAHATIVCWYCHGKPYQKEESP